MCLLAITVASTSLPYNAHTNYGYEHVVVAQLAGLWSLIEPADPLHISDDIPALQNISLALTTTSIHYGEHWLTVASKLYRRGCNGQPKFGLRRGTQDY